MLKVGETCPDFELPSTIGDKIKLSSYLGEKHVLLASFILAFTGG